MFVKKKINKTFIIILIFVIGMFISNTYSFIYAYSPIISSIEIMAPAKSMVLLEGNTDEVLYSYNLHSRVAMASTTKIITAIVAIENCENLDSMFTISDKAVGIEGTSIYLKKGEIISMRSLLFGLILASGNDCAVAIAENLGGLDNFIQKMNTFVETMGLKNTKLMNPHGLDEENHYTSAYDLAKITSYALKNKVFREVVGTKHYTINKTNLNEIRYLKHKNKLMFNNDKCIGVKTGFTDNAGRCLVSAYEDKGMQLISVVLNCQPMFEECDRLTKLALNEYKMKEFILPYNFVSEVNVLKGDKQNVSVVVIKGYKKPIKIKEEKYYRVEYDFPNVLNAPIEINSKVGNVKVYYIDEIVYEGDLYTIDSSKNIDIKYLFDNILNKWF